MHKHIANLTKYWFYDYLLKNERLKLQASRVYILFYGWGRFDNYVIQFFNNSLHIWYMYIVEMMVIATFPCVICF